MKKIFLQKGKWMYNAAFGFENMTSGLKGIMNGG